MPIEAVCPEPISKTIEPGPGDPVGQLYNLRADLAETNNLYLKHPEIVARLEAEMQGIVKAELSRQK